MKIAIGKQGQANLHEDHPKPGVGWYSRMSQNEDAPFMTILPVKMCSAFRPWDLCKPPRSHQELCEAATAMARSA